MTASERKASIGLFLKALFTGKPDGLYILLWTLADKRSHWFRDVEAVVACAESLADSDVYVGVSLSPQDYGPANRCVSAATAGLVGFSMDVDFRSDAHAKSALPSTIEEALSILPQELPPTFVVFTGNGIHVWWLFRELWIFQNDDERKQAAALAKRWATFIRDRGRARGWAIERLADLARILRIPGTMNCKDAANPKPVTFLVQSAHRYNPSDFVNFLDERGLPDCDAEDIASRQWAEQLAAKPLKIDFAAEIPQTQLDQWLDADERFKKTWFRQRSDLVDQTQSGYDLALANFGFRVGLDEQKIIDLLIHHRRIHKQEGRLTLHYLRVTLAKAAPRSDNEWSRRSAAEAGPLADDVEGASEIDKPRKERVPISDEDKLRLCNKLSAVLKIEILRIVKVSGREPIYRIECPEGKIDFPGTAKLMYQPFFRQAIAGRVGILVSRMKPLAWESIVQTILDACMIEDGGEEMESEGSARIFIDQYLEGNTLVYTFEELIGPNKLKPMIRNGRIAINAGDLQSFINRTTQQNLSIPAVVSMLSAIGAKMVRVRGKTIKEQSRWELPLEEFDPKEYSPSEGDASQ